MRRGLAYFLFLLSGATALCYEVAWTRHLVLVFGSTTRAVALILAAYMLGLALGSEVGGRIADRVRRPAVLYAAAEALIGAYALAFPAIIGIVRSAYVGLGTSATPVLFLGAFVALLVPTFLMGATLPLLVRACVTDVSATGGVVGRLYGANILGAVIGTSVTGFVLMESAGVMGATRIAAAVNVAIAAIGWLAFRDAAPPQSGGTEPGSVPPPSTAATRAALVSAFAAGLVGLAAEVLWTRLLTFTLQGFTYTFSAMLAMFLLGLALGGFAFARVAARTSDPTRILVRLHAAVGVVAAGVLIALSHHYALSAWLWDVTASVYGKTGALRDRHILQLLLASAAILLPPAFLMGGVFPLAAAAYRRGLGDLGARIGRLYMINTIGAVTGSLLAGFVLAPLAGLTWGAVWAAGLSIAAAVAVSVVAGSRRWLAPAVGAVATAALVVYADPGRPFIERSHVFAGEKARENRLVETRSGAVCQVSVVANDRERYSLLYTDEFEAAGTKPEYRYMRLLAHLPVALAEDPSRVLVICFGTGTTTGSVSTHSAVKRLDVVEISPEVLEVADRFASVNRGALRGAGRTDLDVAVHVDDGRNFVLRSREQWGVITLEPLMPYTPAAIHLYTEDFYRECAPRLAPGGLMCQWIPLQGMSGDDFKRLVSAFVAVFPDSGCFFVDGAVALIGGNQPFAMPYERVAARLSDPLAKSDLADVGFDDPVRALATFVAGGERLRQFVDRVPPVTDEFPVLEFHPIPPRVVTTNLWENVQSMKRLRELHTRLPVDISGVSATDEVETQLFLALRAGGHLLDGAVAVEAGDYRAAEGKRGDSIAAVQEARHSFGLAVSIDPSNESARRAFERIEREWQTGLASDALARNDLAAAEVHLRRATAFAAARQADVAWTRLAETLSRAEKFDDALAAATEATRLFPRGLEARCERAYARAALGDLDGAAADYRRALEGAGPETIASPRLRQDAERVLAAGRVGESPDDLGTQIEEALAAALDPSVRWQQRLKPRAVLLILAADRPDEYAAHFAGDLAAAGSPATPRDARARAIRRLSRAGPAGALDAASRVLADPAATRAECADAAALVADAGPASFAPLLDPSRPHEALAAAVAVAGTRRDLRVVGPLLRLLEHEDREIRTLTQVALFARVGDKAPHLARLDVAAFPSAAYRDAVADIRAWWAREQDSAESPR